MTRVGQEDQTQFRLYFETHFSKHGITSVELCFTPDGKLIMGFPAVTVDVHTLKAQSQRGQRDPLSVFWHPTLDVRQTVRRDYNQCIFGTNWQEIVVAALENARSLGERDYFPIRGSWGNDRKRWQHLEKPSTRVAIDSDGTILPVRSIECERDHGSGVSLITYMVGSDIATQYNDRLHCGLSVLNAQGDQTIEIKVVKVD